MVSRCALAFISIHAPAKGATSVAGIPEVESEISIHAPAKGATPAPAQPKKSNEISIHAPAKGATAMPEEQISDTIRFQSTLPRRERQYTIVSGDTLWNFNPRSREGSDSSAGT